MRQSSESSAGRRLPRFTRGERWLHRAIAIDVGVLMITAAILFFPDLAGLVGNRQIVRPIHEIAGWLLPIPLLLAIGSRAFRSDAGVMNRFRQTDWEWFRSRDRRSGRLPVDKFNPGQKLNGAFMLGALIVLFVTGVMMFFSTQFPDAIRTGATFVHDWLALAVVVVVLGHIYMAFKDATARLGMRTGEVPEEWAMREHRGWAEEVLGKPDSGADSETSPPVWHP
jgi:formate dehydrogenase subunit gamma